MRFVFGVMGVIVFCVGIALLLNAPDVGADLADTAVQAYGGGMDTERFYFLMKAYALSYQLAGTLCALVGGAFAVLFIHKGLE